MFVCRWWAGGWRMGWSSGTWGTRGAPTGEKWALPGSWCIRCVLPHSQSIVASFPIHCCLIPNPLLPHSQTIVLPHSQYIMLLVWNHLMCAYFYSLSPLKHTHTHTHRTTLDLRRTVIGGFPFWTHPRQMHHLPHPHTRSQEERTTTTSTPVYRRAR